jgi:predicted nuclease of predicted toxin-antitoxin system
MKLLIDMNLSPRWGRLLGSEGFEAVHWSDVGPADASDREIMDHARTHGFVVLTHDLDSGAILAATRDAKPSVVQIRADDISPGSDRRSRHNGSCRFGHRVENPERDVTATVKTAAFADPER